MKNLGNIFYIVTLVKEDMQRQTDNILESGLVDLLGEKIINESTQSNGYMISSVYKTDLEDKEIKVLGDLNNFLNTICEN